jgi:hypothetical protein
MVYTFEHRGTLDRQLPRTTPGASPPLLLTPALYTGAAHASTGREEA